MTKERFKWHLIQLVADNSEAVKLILSSPAFLDLNGEMTNKLGVSLQSHSIRNVILCEAMKQKNKLKEELQELRTNFCCVLI